MREVALGCTVSLAAPIEDQVTPDNPEPASHHVKQPPEDASRGVTFSAVAFGATVTGVCSGDPADLVRSLGAGDVVDYTKDDFADGSRRFDLILDIGGRTSVARLRRALTQTGTLVILGGEGDRWIGGTQRQLWASLRSGFVSQRLVAFVVKENADELLRLNELVAAGKVTHVLGPTFPLADGAGAIAAFESGHTQGRIVILPGDR